MLCVPLFFSVNLCVPQTSPGGLRLGRGRAEGLGEGKAQLIEGAEVRKEVGDVAGDVGIGAERDASTLLHASAEEVELKGILVVVDLGGDTGLGKHTGDGAVEVAGHGAAGPGEVAEGVGEDGDGHGQEPLDIAEPGALDFDRLLKQQARQALVCQALWELVSERLGLTDEDLAKRVEEIDLRDGQADGKIGTRQLTCPQCGRPANSSRRTCVYCGAALDVPYAFG